MNKVANSYSINARLVAQNSSRAEAINLAGVRSFAGTTASDARSIARPRADRRSGRPVSSSAVFVMVILTMFAICFTVTLRTSAEMQTATAQYATVNAEVEALRNTNTELKQQVQRLHTDPRAIETAARERLGMVRPNDIIVPVR